MATPTFLYGSSRETTRWKAPSKGPVAACGPSIRTTDGGKRIGASMSYVARTRSRTTVELTR